MRKVLRYSIPINSYAPVDIELPIAFNVRHVGYKNSEPDYVQVWIESYQQPRTAKSRFQVFATGQEIPAEAVYVGTAVLEGGYEVWHVYRF